MGKSGKEYREEQRKREQIRNQKRGNINISEYDKKKERKVA